MSSPITPPAYQTSPNTPGLAIHESLFDPTKGTMKQPSDIVLLTLENRQLKLKLDASTVNCGILTKRLCEYILLLRDMEARHSHAEAKSLELDKMRRTDMDMLNKEIEDLRKTCEKSEADISALREKLMQLKESYPALIYRHWLALNLKQNLQETEVCPQSSNNTENSARSLEYKPVYHSPEEMMRTRFDILAHLPVPEDILVDFLKPIGIPERFTIHEFLLGSASGSLKNALSGYCAFTENTTMWCPEREEHGFYLTPLYKCDTGPRSNVIHRWVKVDVAARMPRPTECFYRKGDEWYYTGTYQSLRLEDLTPKEYDNLSQSTRDALIKETLAGRKNTTPQVVFETSQLYAVGALKVAVVGIQCVGFNHMLYSVALQQAQRFKTSVKGRLATADDTSNAANGTH